MREQCPSNDPRARPLKTRPRLRPNPPLPPHSHNINISRRSPTGDWVVGVAGVKRRGDSSSGGMGM